MRDPIVDDEVFEPFDALLDEVVREAPAVAVRRGSRLLAAALLILGVGVVVGVMLGRRDGERPAANQAETQEPQGGEKGKEHVRKITPQSLREWRELLPRVKQIVAIRRVPRVTGESSVDFGVSSDEVAIIAAAADVQVWRAAMVGSTAADDGRGWVTWHRAYGKNPVSIRSLQLHLMIEGGSEAVAPCLLDPKPRISFVVADGYLDVTESLQTLLLQAYEDALRNGRIARGEPLSIDELRALPATSRRVTCWCMTAAEARSELSRFIAIERLVLERRTPVQTGEPGKSTNGALTFSIEAPPNPHGDVIAVISSLSTLRALSLPGGALDAGDLQMLAKLPHLEEFETSGGLPGGILAGLPAIGGKVHTLRLHLHSGVDYLGPAHPAREPRRLEAEAAMAAIVEVATHLPKLRCLDLGGSDVLGDGAFAWLSVSKLEQLQLDGTPVTGRQLAWLAGLPSLRQLSLTRTHLGEADVEALGKLRQVRRLELGDTDITTDGFETLKAALPQCEITAEPRSRVFRDEDGKLLRHPEPRK